MDFAMLLKAGWMLVYGLADMVLVGFPMLLQED